MHKIASYIFLSNMLKKAGTGAASTHGQYGNISNSWGNEVIAAGGTPQEAQNWIDARNNIVGSWNPFYNMFYLKNMARAEQAQREALDRRIKQLKAQPKTPVQQPIQQPTAVTPQAPK